MTAIAYRMRQGLCALRPRLPADRDEIVARVLTPDQAAAFRVLPVHDQAHLCRVCRLLQHEGIADRDLLTAALLHDLGKVDTHGRVRVPDRVARVLLQRFAPGMLARLAALPAPSWRRGLALAVHHPRLVAERATALGCPPRACWLIAHHEDHPPPAGRDLQRLMAADRAAGLRGKRRRGPGVSPPDSVDCTDVSTQATDQTTLNGYQLRLPTFEGPLDVLLRLIERSQLAITDVSLVAVTDQFLAYVAELGEVPAATIAEFAAVAARLVLLKSRSLLPRPPAPADDDEPDELVHELVTYRAIKDAAQHLAAWDARGLGAFPRGEGGVATPREAAPARLAPIQAAALARAIRRRLTVVTKPPEIKALRPAISLREMLERVLSDLTGRRLPFHALAWRARDRHEVLTAFLAVLILVRRRAIEAEQDELFGEILLRPLAGAAQILAEAAADD